MSGSFKFQVFELLLKVVTARLDIVFLFFLVSCTANQSLSCTACYLVCDVLRELKSSHRVGYLHSLNTQFSRTPNEHYFSPSFCEKEKVVILHHCGDEAVITTATLRP